MPVEDGNTVKVRYTGKLDDGSVFDTTEEKDPLEFEVGAGKIIKGFEEQIKGMEKGEEKQFTLTPDQAYGEPNPALVKSFPREKLPEGQEPKEGMMLMMSTQEGKQFPAKIQEIGEQEVKIDLNPPLAGKTLHFDVKIEDYS